MSPFVGGISNQHSYTLISFMHRINIMKQTESNGESGGVSNVQANAMDHLNTLCIRMVPVKQKGSRTPQGWGGGSSPCLDGQ